MSSSVRLRLVFAAQLVSVAGNQLLAVALPWYVVTRLGSATGMGIIAGVEMAVISLTALPSGALLDRVGARRILLAGDVVMGSMALLMAWLGHAGRLGFATVLVLAALAAVPQAGYMAAIQLFLTDLVGSDDAGLTKASSERVLAVQVGAILGSAVAGVLMGWVGWIGLMAIDAVTFAVSFVAFIVCAPTRTAPADAQVQSAPRGLATGLTFLFSDGSRARRTLGAAGQAALLQALVLAIPVSLRGAATGPRWFGWILTGMSIGGILGSLTARRLSERLSSTALFQWGLVLGAVAYLLPLLVAAPKWGLMALFFVSEFAATVASSGLFAILTRDTPQDMLGRMWTAWSAVMTIAAPLGSVGGGMLLDNAGIRTCFAAFAALGVVACLVQLDVIPSKARPHAPTPE